MEEQSIYKIFTKDQWQDFNANGSFQGSPLDIKDGFIHLSKQDQVQKTINKFFKNITGLIIAEFNTNTYNNTLKWEASSSGEFFPHIYEPLSLEQLVGYKVFN